VSPTVPTKPAGASAFTPRRILANSLSNTVQTMASFVLGYVVPPLLIRWVPKDAYPVFLLASRVGAFLMVLDLGVQLSLQRILSQSLASGDHEGTHDVIRAAGALFRKIALVGAAFLLLAAYFFPRVFTAVPSNLVLQARICLVLFGGTSLVALMLIPYSGLLVAANQTPLVLGRTIFLRIGSAVAVVAAAKQGASIIVLATISSVAGCGVAFLPYVMSRRLFPWLRERGRPARRDISRLLISEAGPLAIITLAGFLLSQLDVLVVGKVAYGKLAAYSLCIAVITGLEQLHSGLMQPMLPALTVGRTTKSRSEYRRQFRMSARLVAALWAFMALGTFVIAPQLTRLWVGPTLGREMTPVLRIVLVAYFVRYGDWAFGVSVVAAGQFKRIMGGPIFGSIFHLFCTVLLGALYGSIGVAVGTLVAAAGTMLFVRLVSMPRTVRIVPVQPNRYFVDSLLVPSIVALPFIGVSLVIPVTGVGWSLFALALGVVGALAVAAATLRVPVAQLRHAGGLLKTIRSGTVTPP
jgi:O-antigen/teichoic acid export membrane protein